MPDIGIIGGGVGGTHLGLFLRQHGVSATIYSAKTPAEHLAARITNVVCRSGTTRAREVPSSTSGTLMRPISSSSWSRSTALGR